MIAWDVFKITEFLSDSVNVLISNQKRVYVRSKIRSVYEMDELYGQGSGCRSSSARLGFFTPLGKSWVDAPSRLQPVVLLGTVGRFDIRIRWENFKSFLCCHPNIPTLFYKYHLCVPSATGPYVGHGHGQTWAWAEGSRAGAGQEE